MNCLTRAKEGEIWKPVYGYPHYQVSNVGTVKNSKGLVLIPQPSVKGYLTIGLYKDKKCKRKSVHSVVLEAFISPRPLGLHGCHKDGNKLNNHLYNLAWVTPKENISHKVAHGTYGLGEKNAFAKLTWKQVLEIRSRYKRVHRTNTNSRQLCKEYGICPTTVLQIVKRETWNNPLYLNQ